LFIAVRHRRYAANGGCIISLRALSRTAINASALRACMLTSFHQLNNLSSIRGLRVKPAMTTEGFPARGKYA